MQPQMTGNRGQDPLLDLPAHPSAVAAKPGAHDDDAAFEGDTQVAVPGRSRFLTTRVWDWLFVLIFLVGGTILLEVAFEPAKRYIDVTDVSIQKPLDGELVPSYALGILALLSSIATFCVFEFPSLRGTGWMRIFSIFYLGFVEACGITLFATNVLKLIVGRPRPFFATLCKTWESNRGFVCKEGNPNIKDALSKIAGARKSFPSGHSSLSFACFVYLTLYMAHRLQITNPKTTCRAAKLGALSLPIMTAALVAASRLVDHHHFYADVLAGAVLGTGVAVAVWTARKKELEAARTRVQRQTASGEMHIAGEFPNQEGPGRV